jgi:hypothetical protein
MNAIIKSTFKTAIILLFIAALSVNAQKKEKPGVKDVKGKAEKITIKTDKGEFVFEGKEAQEILKKLKTGNRKSVWFSETGGDDGSTYVVNIDDIASDVLVSLAKENNFTWETEDEEDGKKIERKINIEEENGVKKLTITTTEDGEEKTETYEGAEAEEYLEKMKEENKLKVFSKDGGSRFAFFFDSDSGDVDKEINVTVEDGIKKLTITTTVDGKEKVEEYIGDEADRKLKELEKNSRCVFSSGDDSHEFMIKINKDGKSIKLNKKLKINVEVEDDDSNATVKKIIIKKEKDDDD